MAAVIPNEGRTTLGAQQLAYLDTCLMGIWTGAHVPAVGDTLATYAAVEASFGGYARATVSGWFSVGIDANGNEQLSAPAVSFTSTGSGLPQTGSGYFLTDPSQTHIIAVEVAAASFTWTAAGQSWQVTPNLYLGALSPPL